MRRTRCQSGQGRPVVIATRPRRRAAACLGLVLVAVAGVHELSTESRAQVPGPEIFAKDPKTPLELWDAIDYLVRTGQAKAAAPYLKKFMATGPDDASLLQVRDRYGFGSILRLQDDPATRAQAEPLVLKLAEASRGHATNPERVNRFIADLTKTRDEQNYAVERLREAGPYAVPALVKALDSPSLSPEDRALLVRNIGRLDSPAAPPLIATLDAPKPQLVIDAAEALGRLGDPRAVPALTAATAGPAAAAARRAVEALTGQPFAAQSRTPARLLADEARRYQTHQVKFPGDSVVIWTWDAGENVPVAKTVSKGEAETHFGLKYARAALAFEPTDRATQVALLGLALEQAVGRSGFTHYPAGDPSNTFATAVAAGPDVLGDVLRSAILAGKADLAAVAATALGKVTDGSELVANGPFNPLVEALSAPGRRTRFAAARALVNLDPKRPFAGSSAVVPVLAQFLASRQAPRAVVIDGNLARGNMIASHLRSLGFDTDASATGDEGFRAAASSADTELVLLDHHMTQGNWRLHDTLANLRADARTAALPIYVYSPLNHQVDLGSLEERFPGVRLIVTPVNPRVLDQELGVVGRPAALAPAERSAYAAEAAALLAKIAARPNSPFGPDLLQVEPTLAVALNIAETARSTTAVLGDVPLADAQRGLADALLDPTRPAPLRLGTANQLARSIQKFGPLVAADQEVKLLSAFDQEADPAFRTALGTVIGALRPKPGPIGDRLRKLLPSPTLNPNPALPSPEAAPSPEPNPNPAPAPEAPPAPVPPPGDEPK